MNYSMTQYTTSQNKANMKHITCMTKKEKGKIKINNKKKSDI